MFPSPRDPQFGANPYLPPEAPAGLGFPASANRELDEMRRKFLGQESIIRGIAYVHYALAIFGAVILGDLGFWQPFQLNGMRGWFTSADFLVIASFGGALGINLALANGLRTLQPWARWAEIILLEIAAVVSLALIGVFAFRGNRQAPVVLGLIFVIEIFVLSLLLRTRGAVVFSKGYLELRQRTPHIKSGTGLLMKFWVILLSVLLIGLVIGYITIRSEL